jgi:hypothetical protein
VVSPRQIRIAYSAMSPMIAPDRKATYPHDAFTDQLQQINRNIADIAASLLAKPAGFLADAPRVTACGVTVYQGRDESATGGQKNAWKQKRLLPPDFIAR